MINNSRYETKRIKLNFDLRGLKKDSEVEINVDRDGVPIDRYWRDRLKDSELDKCIEFVSVKKQTKSKNNIIEKEGEK